MMKQRTAEFETSTWVSNLMLASAVVAAAAPLLLGERLVSIVSSAVTQAVVLLQSLNISLQSLLS
jgi:hypothetical protein